ncbi:hypothetical protein K432DRAFT_425154 [Lepidopterella palustris CBS 459.81]|uniref:Uncharacterized protein n=1 Tax=Lepidopterella palustris CBS 459.81 TaxID=1314670 RepID=A0A8E2EBY1_9PEZI|nr:hypothetical protein K432DRAFT_425154 [Lepidopterella palustris CBS 459.81]
MDPLPPAALAGAVLTLVGASFNLGARLHGLYNQQCAASREFEAFSHEVRTFGGVWQMIQPCLADSRPWLRGDCLRTLGHICHDTTEILREVTDLIDEFTIRDRKAIIKANIATRRTFALFGTKPVAADRDHRIKEFLKRNDFALQRSQLLYANTTLQLILNVINYARTVPDANTANEFFHNSNLIIIEQNRAWDEMSRRENQEKRERRHLRVEAGAWLGRLPEPDLRPRVEGRASPFDILANQWITPDALESFRGLPDGSVYDDDSEDGRAPFRTVVQQLRDENNQRDQQIVALNQDIDNLTQQMNQHVQYLNNVVENLSAQSAQYEQERNEAREESQRYRQERDQALEERNRALGERDAARQTLNKSEAGSIKYRNERDRAAEQRDEMRKNLKDTAAHRDQYLDARNQERAARVQAQRGLRMAEADRVRYRAERDQAYNQRDQAITERDEALKELNEITAARERSHRRNAVLTRERDKARDDLKEMTAARDKYHMRSHALTKEKELLQEKIDHFIPDQHPTTRRGRRPPAPTGPPISLLTRRPRRGSSTSSRSSYTIAVNSGSEDNR